MSGCLSSAPPLRHSLHTGTEATFLRRRWSIDTSCLSLRLVKHAIERRKPVMLLNVGPTRADQLLGVETIEIPAGTVMRDVVKAVLYVLGPCLYSFDR